jgi:hypothetical protein
METHRNKRKQVSEKDVQDLLSCNQMLKEHLDFLRAKLSKTEAILEMYIKAVEKEDEKKLTITNTFSLN